jgi:hypothetical protein
MKLKMAKYEVKHLDNGNWRWVSEATVLEILQKNFAYITPIITEMLNGKEITTPDDIFRIKK